MSSAFDVDFDWQQRFKPHFVEIAQGAIRVRVAGWEDDARRNTDYLVCRMENDFRVTARARRSEHRARFGGQFTIRFYRPSGAPTEMAKMRQGFGDFGMYGFEAHEGADRLRPWFLYNVELLREYLDNGGRWYEQRNNDGTRFAAFDIQDVASTPAFVLNSDGLTLGPQPDGPCRICGYTSWKSDLFGPVHDCCTRVGPGEKCPACSASNAGRHRRYGWPDNV